MRGFDAEFGDLPDYIVKITERIWEGRAVGSIRRYYSDDCIIHTSMGPASGVGAVTAGTLDTLNAFPDRRLLPEEIIWSGDEQAGFLSSHRLIAPATHLGHSAFGPPSGREVQFRAIADCVCVENRIVEEWLVRDQAGVAAQIGLDADTWARELAAKDALAGKAPWHLDYARMLRAVGELRPAVLQDHPAAVLVRDGMVAIWGQADIDVVQQLYHPACIVQAPGDLALAGHERFSRWLFGLLSAFPDARIAIEHSIANRSDRGAHVATRWWLTATHSGYGRFGPPSGATILLLGITHSNVVDGRVRDEWIVADEIAVRKQIALHRG